MKYLLLFILILKFCYLNSQTLGHGIMIVPVSQFNSKPIKAIKKDPAGESKIITSPILNIQSLGYDYYHGFKEINSAWTLGFQTGIHFILNSNMTLNIKGATSHGNDLYYRLATEIPLLATITNIPGYVAGDRAGFFAGIGPNLFNNFGKNLNFFAATEDRPTSYDLYEIPQKKVQLFLRTTAGFQWISKYYKFYMLSSYIDVGSTGIIWGFSMSSLIQPKG